MRTLRIVIVQLPIEALLCVINGCPQWIPGPVILHALRYFAPAGAFDRGFRTQNRE